MDTYSIDWNNKTLYTIDKDNNYHSYYDRPAIQDLNNNYSIWMHHGIVHPQIIIGNSIFYYHYGTEYDIIKNYNFNKYKNIYNNNIFIKSLVDNIMLFHNFNITKDNFEQIIIKFNSDIILKNIDINDIFIKDFILTYDNNKIYELYEILFTKEFLLKENIKKFIIKFNEMLENKHIILNDKSKYYKCPNCNIITNYYINPIRITFDKTKILCNNCNEFINII